MVSSILPRSRLTIRGSKVTGMSTASLGGSFATVSSWTVKPTDGARSWSMTNDTGQLPALRAAINRLSTLLRITGPKSSWYSGSRGLTYTQAGSPGCTSELTQLHCLTQHNGQLYSVVLVSFAKATAVVTGPAVVRPWQSYSFFVEQT